MQMGVLYRSYVGKILREWRKARARNSESTDLLALIYVHKGEVIYSLLDRKFAVEELLVGIEPGSRNQLTLPADKADPPVPLALWVLLINEQENKMIRLVDNILSQGGSA